MVEALGPRFDQTRYFYRYFRWSPARMVRSAGASTAPQRAMGASAQTTLSWQRLPQRADARRLSPDVLATFRHSRRERRRSRPGADVLHARGRGGPETIWRGRTLQQWRPIRPPREATCGLRTSEILAEPPLAIRYERS